MIDHHDGFILTGPGEIGAVSRQLGEDRQAPVVEQQIENGSRGVIVLDAEVGVVRECLEETVALSGVPGAIARVLGQKRAARRVLEVL